MRVLSVARRIGFRWRTAAVAVLALTSVLGLGARCIENTSVRVDSEGYTHITGKLVNDTDIQGAELTLRGTLFDAANNVIATKDQAPCPPDLSPYSEVMFDIRFDNPGIPPHDHYSVNMVKGRALPSKLLDPDVVLFNQEAIRFEGIPPIPGLPITSNDVLFAFNARNRSQNTYTVQACGIVINNKSEVIYAVQTEVVDIDQGGGLVPFTMTPLPYPVSLYAIARNVPPGPIQVKAWLWFGPKDAPTSQYQYVETPLFSIQTQGF